MSRERTLDEWRARLERQGHCVAEPERETVTGFTLLPDAGTWVTVAVEPDGSLYPQFRQRFFLCEPQPEQVFHVLGCPDPHRTRWLERVLQQPPGYWRDFLAGPGSWLLCRLARYREVVAWSDHGLPWDCLDCSTHRDWGMEVPAEASPFFAATVGPESPLPPPGPRPRPQVRRRGGRVPAVRLGGDARLLPGRRGGGRGVPGPSPR